MELSPLLWQLGKIAGILGYLCLSALIISGDTARFMDRFFGMDRIIKFQRKFSTFTTVLVLSHPIFFMLSSGGWQWAIIPDFSLLPLAVGILALYVMLVIQAASKLYKFISYGWWQVIHILIYALFFMSLYHANNWGSDAGTWWLQAIFMVTFVLMIISIIYRTQYKIRKLFAGTFTVKDLVWETKDTFSLYVNHSKPFKFTPGQFAFIRLDHGRIFSRHPLTISSHPDDEALRFTIKCAGRFTKVASQLKKGQRIKVDGPFGNFVRKDKNRPLLFIAGGVGITPFMSLIKDRAKDLTSKQEVVLLYGSQTRGSIIFEKELHELQKDNPWLTVTHVLSREKTAPAEMKTGYINKEVMVSSMSDLKSAMVYICGPESLKNSVKQALKDLGMPSSRIKVEDFFW